MDKKDLNYYSKTEEKLNVITHGIGLLLSIVALVFLTMKALEIGSLNYMVSFTVFGISLILLYGASTFYHISIQPNIRAKFKILDHAAIYVLIAGTYTPFTLITLNGWIGWTILSAVWGVALVGIFLKLFYTGRFKKISTIAYVVMGWIIVFAIIPLIEQLSLNGLLWLFSGGVLYTIGAVFYSMNKVKYNHAIFHVFVLLGSLFHFISIYFHV